MPVVCGIDSSTQSTKLQLRDAETGAVLAQTRHPHPPTTPPRSEQDPGAWWESLRTQLASATEGRGDEPVALSVAAQQHGMVVLGHDGAVLRPAKLWNDTESAPDADALVPRLGGPARWAALTGSVPGPAFTITKLAWLARVEPKIHARVARVLLPHDWLTWQLSGSVVTDRGDASGTGYFSAVTDTFLPEVLGLVGLDESAVPRLAGPSEAVGEWGRAAVAAGTGDNMAVALGVGLEAGDVVVSVGTSGTVFALSDRPSADPTGAVAGFADATGRFLPLVCTLNAARVTDAVARLLDVDGDGFDRLALAGPPGAGGLVLLPYLDGERTPNRPGATGVLLGLRSDVSRADLARAAVEGVVCGLLDGLDALGAAGVDTASGRLLLVGGGARSAAYRQILADLSGRQVTVPDGDELAAAGACVQAATLSTGATAAEVAEAWALGGGVTVDPAGLSERAAVRAAYRAARDAEVGGSPRGARI
ncbi:MAG: xylulokinase [Acidimicrobiales bacterium]